MNLDNVFSAEFIGLFITLAGLIIGLGAVTVIDWHGFLGRKSAYWTEATTRSHKVTKPLIWLGTTLFIIGSLLFYRNHYAELIPRIQGCIAILLILNGLFLTFSVSPFLIKREREGKARDLLPSNWQIKITISFIVSFVGWWSEVALLAWWLTHRI